MKKSVVAFLTIFMVVVLLLAVFLSLRPLGTGCDVGIFYYVWYNPEDPTSWEAKKIVDKPVLDYYNSCDSEVIKQHLTWFEDLGINMLIVSWWGFEYIDYYSAFGENAAHQVFRTAREQNVDIKICIMVEPFYYKNESTTYDYAEIYDYIYDNFLAPYNATYYEYHEKPLLCFFNDKNLTPNGIIPRDNRFEVKIVGGEDYVDWIYTDLVMENNETAKNKQKSVTPRFDDSRVPNRISPIFRDVNLTEGIYDNEWKDAIELAKRREIDIITICSWNEYPERTAIEPHRDATAFTDDTHFLYNKTKGYIEELKSQT